MAVNSLEDLNIDCLGYAGLVHECTLVSISVGSDHKMKSKLFFLHTKSFNSGFTFYV